MKKESLGNSHKILGYGIVLILLSAPLWVPILQKSSRASIFLASDSLIWLGATILAGLVSETLLPDPALKFGDQLTHFVKSKFNFLAAVFLPLLTIALYAINQKVLHGFMNSGDEHSCYFLAECIRNGKWWATPHPLSEFFEVVHVGNKGGKWFSVYPIGWPLIWSIGIQFKVVEWLNPVMVTMSLAFFYHAGKNYLALCLPLWV